MIDGLLLLLDIVAMVGLLRWASATERREAASAPPASQRHATPGSQSVRSGR